MELNVENVQSKLDEMIREVIGLSAMALYLYNTTSDPNEKLEYQKSIEEYNEYLVKLNKLKNNGGGK